MGDHDFYSDCDAHDIPVILGAQLGIGVDHGLAHALGMVDVLAKHDGLGIDASGGQELG